MPELIGREQGRQLFGADPETYDRARPGHPEQVYEILAERCGLGRGTSVLEIGPGTGQATRRLLELGASPLVAIEPNRDLAGYLSRSVGARADIRVVALEDAELPPARFDLAAAASSFHWIDESIGLPALFDALRPGAWVALWWTGFGDPARPDPFHDATRGVLDGMPKSPAASHRGGQTPTEFGSPRWLDALAAAHFEEVSLERIPWSAIFDARRIREIFSTFSPFLYVDEQTRTTVLDALETIATVDFENRVDKPLLTALYTARKPS